MRIENSYIRAHRGLEIRLQCRAGEKYELPRHVLVADTTFDPLVPSQSSYHENDVPDASIVMFYER